MSSSVEPPDAPGYDPTVPSLARMFDYFLGGKDNFAADRDAAALVLEHAPEVPLVAQEGRRFLRRVVRFLADAGIRQFIDIGTGLPTQGHVHELLAEFAPDARVAYVDNDPVVATHARALLADHGHAIAIQADMRRPAKILEDSRLTSLIDLDEPVAVLLLSVLHFVEDDEATSIVSHLRDAIVPGSYLAFSQAVSDTRPETLCKLSSIYQAGPMKNAEHRDLPTIAQISRFLDGLEPVAPGVVPLPAWRPDRGVTSTDVDAIWLAGGVGRKP